MLLFKLFIRLCEMFEKPDELSRRLDELRKEREAPQKNETDSD